MGCRVKPWVKPGKDDLSGAIQLHPNALPVISGGIARRSVIPAREQRYRGRAARRHVDDDCLAVGSWQLLERGTEMAEFVNHGAPQSHPGGGTDCWPTQSEDAGPRVAAPP